MIAHEKYMQRCLELAAKGFGSVAPNPMVGCVIVHEGKVVGEGYHEQFGGPHAEVNAINSVGDKSLLRSSTLYVSLEPCSHFGKTPPCADLIIRYKIKYVIVGALDPNPLVSGRGIHKLTASGCDVKIGVLDKECRELNKRFYTFHEKKRPYVILKWAQTADGFIGIKNFKFQISNFKSQQLVHSWRSEELAIMVGTQTALIDDPELTVRKVKGKNPLRVVIDKDLKIPPDFHLLDGSVPTLVFTSKENTSNVNLDYITIDFGKDILKQVLKELHGRNIQSLIVEGGAKLLNSFIAQNYWDEARLITSPKNLIGQLKEKEGVKAPLVKGKKMVRYMSGDDEVVILSNQ